VWNFGRKSRTRRTLGSHQIRFFRRRSEQLVSREARGELEEALAHVLGAEASLEATLTVDKHRPSRLTVTGLRCHSLPIKVSINMFPSSLWFRRSKPHKKPTTVAQENSNSSEPPCSAATHHHEHELTPPPAGASCLSRRIGYEESMATQRLIGSKHPSRDTDLLDSIRAVDPESNSQHLMMSVGLWAGDDGSGSRCCGHILWIFLKENNSINPKNHWNLRILQKHKWTFS
jgi:hypothetical protein